MRWKVKPNSSHVGLNFLMALIYLDDFGVFSITNMHPLLVFFLAGDNFLYIGHVNFTE